AALAWAGNLRKPAATAKLLQARKRRRDNDGVWLQVNSGACISVMGSAYLLMARTHARRVATT
ncbi:hypothetical protein BRN41_10785, partial [Xanthomonas oryzae pv. oryzae]